MKSKKRGVEHYTIGDALVVLFSNPLFYFCLVAFVIFWSLK